MRQMRLGPQPARGLQAVHDRHLHVHQHQVVGHSAGPLHGPLTIGNHIHVHAHLAQEFLRHLLIELVVLHQQHAGPLQGKNGVGSAAVRVW